MSTTGIITELEREPRGIYTGTVGAISPGGPGQIAVFNVAIRTAWVDRLTNTAEYGIGGGIVWDSTAESEWREALDKARILSRARPDLRLLETMRWEPTTGVANLDRHLRRLQSSAHHFGYQLDTVAIKEQLNLLDAGSDLEVDPNVGTEVDPEIDTEVDAGRVVGRRLRLLVDWEGGVELEVEPLGEPFCPTPREAIARSRRPGRGARRVVLDREPVDSDDEFLFHKTTERSRYQQARERFPDHDDVVLWNQRREATETTIANLVISRNGELVTPPVTSGVLPGTYRAALLHDGVIAEAVIGIDELAEADELFMVNSLRGWVRLSLDRQA